MGFVPCVRSVRRAARGTQITGDTKTHVIAMIPTDVTKQLRETGEFPNGKTKWTGEIQHSKKVNRYNEKMMRKY